MANIGKPIRLVNPGKRSGKRLTLLQKLHFGSKRQRAAAAARLHTRNAGKFKPKNRKIAKSRTSSQETYNRRRHDARYSRFRQRSRQQNIGEIITVRPLTNSGRSKQAYHKRNVAAGFYDEDGIFHPMRASYDYDPKRVGEKGKSKRRKNTGNMAKSRKHHLAGLKAARTRARNRASRHHNTGHRRRNTGYRRRRHHNTGAVVHHHRRYARRNRGYRRNPNVLSGDFGTAIQIVAGAFITNMLSAFLPSGLNTGIPSYIGIALIALLQGVAVGKLLKNPRLGNNLTIGGFVYLTIKIANDFMPSLGLTSLSGFRGLGLVGPSSFYTPQVPLMGSMGTFVQPAAVRQAIAAAAPPPSTGVGMRGMGSVRRIGRMR